MHLERKKNSAPSKSSKIPVLISFIFLALPVCYTQTGRKLSPLISIILEQWATRSNMVEARILE